MKSVDWKRRDTLALLIIPLELGLLFLFTLSKFMNQPIVVGLAPFFFKLLSLGLIVVLFHDLLAENWRRFTRRLWLKLLICAAAAAAMYYILSGVRWLVGISQSSDIMESVTGGLPYGIYLLSTSAPILAPVTEEIVFRHVLFYKFRENAALRILMCLFSASLFGAVHLGSFSGQLLLTIPYMVIALLYNLIYYFTKNIWATTTIHLMFNFAQSLFPALVLLIMVRGMS